MKLRFKATDAYLIALAILVVYGFFLRLFSLDALSYWIDESYSVLSAINIGHYGLPYFDSGVLYARSLPHSYLLWGIGSLFGFSEIPMRLPSVIFGVGVIIVLFYIGRALYSNNVGLLTALLCTFSYTQILWSRQARMYMMTEFFFFVAILCLIYFHKTRRASWMHGVIISTFIAILLHKLAYVLLIIIGLYVLFEILAHKKIHISFSFPQKLLFVSLTALLGTIVILGLIGFLRGLEIVDLSMLYSSYLKDHFYAVFFFAIVGFALSFKEKRWSIILGLSYAIIYILASFASTVLHPRYLSFVMPILFFFVANFISYFLSWKKWYGYILSFVVLVVVLVNGFVFVPTVLHFDDGTPQPDFREISRYLDNGDYVISAHSAPLLVYGLQPDLMLDFDLSGKQVGSTYGNENGIDVYSGIPIINDTFAFAGYGFVVVDDMALDRIDRQYYNYIFGNMSLAHVVKNSYWNNIYVFWFEPIE